MCRKMVGWYEERPISGIDDRQYPISVTDRALALQATVPLPSMPISEDENQLDT